MGIHLLRSHQVLLPKKASWLGTIIALMDNRSSEKPVKYIGCCGAYCKTCRAFVNGHCQGCRLGYENGARSIDRVKCKMKLCCFRDRGLETCADCPDYAMCPIIQDFHSKNGDKYSKYQQAIEFIRSHGYGEFIKVADEWKGASGKFVKPKSKKK